MPVQTSAPIARDNDVRLPKLSHGEGGGRTDMTVIAILATTAMGRDRGSNVERGITRRLLRIILTPDQFERTTRHHREGSPAVACRNSPQGGSFCSRGRVSSDRRMAAMMATTTKMTVMGKGEGRWRRRRRRQSDGRKKKKEKNEGRHRDNDCVERRRR
jgi:hypothetical protein